MALKHHLRRVRRRYLKTRYWNFEEENLIELKVVLVIIIGFIVFKALFMR